MYNIYLELEKINEKYNLTGFKQEDGYLFYGDIKLNHKYNGIILKNSLYISMFVPFTFPNELPIVKDITKKINSNFHKNSDDILCLACDVEIFYELKKNLDVSICDFIEKFLIPYLYSYTYYEKYKRVPYGDRKHGSAGILEFYKDYFDLFDDKKALSLLKYMSLNKYRGHDLCPCNSGYKIRKCHGMKILRLLEIVGKDKVSKDWWGIKKEFRLIQRIQYKKMQQEKKFKYYMSSQKNPFDVTIPKFYKKYIEYKKMTK